MLNIQKQMLNILNLHSNLPFMSKMMKIKKCDKFVCKIYQRKLCCSYEIIETSIKSWNNIKESS